jgi:NAD(P)-dependent dehydrogenase (short-subunit alcohol dehydrogenase family)
MREVFCMAVLKDKVAIVTGASSGIGFETAKLFALEGAKVVVGARRSEKLLQLVSEITELGGEAIALPRDVKDESYAKALVELASERFGGLDIAFNNAGTNGALGIDSTELSLEEWNNTLTTNLTSSFLGAKYQLEHMLKRGKGAIIFTSSFVGYTIGFPQNAAYAASKAGLVGLTKALAVEYGSRNIRINALLPGGTDTQMGREFASTPESLEFVKSIHALKRLAAPREIAQSALYLASDAASFTTGTALLVDGGVSICKT